MIIFCQNHFPHFFLFQNLKNSYSHHSPTVSYPFNLGPTIYNTCGNLTTSTETLTKSQYPVNYGSHSQFFMSSIFITFLSSGFLLYCYIYQEISLVTRFPFHNIDFWLSCGVSFYTFVAAITFSVCAGGLHNNATPLVLTQVLSSDSHNVCNEHKVQNSYYGCEFLKK